MSDTRSLSTTFMVEVERFDRIEFQAEGHMLFALYGPGNTPEDPPIRRPWDGNVVWVVVLKNQQGVQALRVMSDSLEDAMELMREAITNTLMANARQLQIHQFDYQQFVELNEQRNGFQRWIDSQYAREIADGKHAQFLTVFCAAKHYLAIERDRLSVRIGRWWRRSVKK